MSSATVACLAAITLSLVNRCASHNRVAGAGRPADRDRSELAGPVTVVGHGDGRTVNLTKAGCPDQPSQITYDEPAPGLLGAAIFSRNLYLVGPLTGVGRGQASSNAAYGLASAVMPHTARRGLPELS